MPKFYLLLIFLFLVNPHAYFCESLLGNETNAIRLLKINKISLVTPTSELNSLLSSKLQDFVGEEFNDANIDKLLQKTHLELKYLGYPSPSVRYEQSEKNNLVTIVIVIEPGEACYISEINYFFRLPPDTEFILPHHSLCRKDIVKSALEKLEQDLNKKNYRNYFFSDPEFIYAKNLKSAALQIKGSIGKKLSFRVEDDRYSLSMRGIMGDPLFAEEELKIIDPESMPSEIIKRYKDLGYDDVKIENTSVNKITDDEFEYYYEIKTGPKYEVNSVKFLGNKYLKDEIALEIMGFDPTWQGKPTLNQQALNNGINELKNYYARKGFWDIKIKEPEIFKKPDRASVSISVYITEGIQRILGEVKIIGATHLSHENILDLMDISPGQDFDQSLLPTSEQKIRAKLIELGYIYSEIEFSIEAVKHLESTIKANLILKIIEGKKVFIGNINIVGLKKSKPYVVSRELFIKSGDTYNPENIKKSKKALLELGIFKIVSIVPEDKNAMSKKLEVIDLIINIREGEPGSVTFGPGYDLVEGLRFSAELGYANLGGSGRRYVVRGEVSEQQNQEAIDNSTLLGRKASFNYLEPFLLGLPVDGQLVLRHQARVTPQNPGLWQINYGGELGVIHKLKYLIEQGLIGLYYGQKVTIEEGNLIDRYYYISAGSFRVGEVGLRFSIDKRNSLSWPTRGFLFESKVSKAEYGFGGNLAYDHWSYQISGYYGFTENFVLMGGLALGAFSNVKRKESDSLDILPASERLEAGGTSGGIVRGFRYASLGPFLRYPKFDAETNEATGEFNKKALGGTRRTNATIEVRYLLLKELAVAAFLDSGTVFLTPAEFQVYKERLEQQNNGLSDTEKASIEENLAYDHSDIYRNPKILFSKHNVSFGGALNFLTPIGSLALSCGFPIKIATTGRCNSDPSLCFDRSKSESFWYNNYICNLNVGTQF